MNEQALSALSSSAPQYDPQPIQQQFSQEDEEMRLAIEASLREEEERK